ncbi:hypothetical protein SADUNF_Sadunf10G0009100 [Salix dunnii]|uniref:Uncharacterized protein n=1 Tax=Salix dunnii TaxID=1413687 RepID=A0A835JRK0_9ROSI|nr:hypothetical protein SADUNF_Sadunf10G0009100 [Salix dunnii]
MARNHPPHKILHDRPVLASLLQPLPVPSQVLSKREGLEYVLLTELAALLTELVAPQMLLSLVQPQPISIPLILARSHDQPISILSPRPTSIQPTSPIFSPRSTSMLSRQPSPKNFIMSSFVFVPSSGWDVRTAPSSSSCDETHSSVSNIVC